VLDIGLPILNGLNAARRIRECSPESKILFVSGNSSWDIVQEGVSTGAGGYVFKSDVGSELVTAVNTILRGEKFIGSRFAGRDSTGTSNV